MVFLLLTGCYLPSIQVSEKLLPPSNTTIIVRQARYVNNTASELNFEIDLYHVIGDYRIHTTNYFYNDLGYDTRVNYPSGGNFILVDSGAYNGSSVIPSSSIILIDESGNYDSLDHYNYRSQGLLKLCQDFVGPSKFLVGGFSKNGKLGIEPIAFFENNFSTYTQSMQPFVFDLSKRTGGESNLYDAVDASLDKLIANGGSTSNIIVLAHANDASSAATIDNLITKATINSIQIHIVFIGDPAETTALAKLSESTHGTFVVCPTTGEMMCSLENFYSILGAADQVYRLKLKYQPSSGTITSGQELWFTIPVYDTYSADDYNPMVIYIKVP